MVKSLRRSKQSLRFGSMSIACAAVCTSGTEANAAGKTSGPVSIVSPINRRDLCKKESPSTEIQFDPEKSNCHHFQPSLNLKISKPDTAIGSNAGGL
uniref:Uncharacterized protein n=1 Tax=Oryza sativa subsp. japonica TaxID=39947 RepID=Q5Z6W8_ORYSJ|nr:hypothetical protein [Oryza sativa Japonica Group]BAD54301.1 hypothetical protein [Oryza sativa Japonica Group]